MCVWHLIHARGSGLPVNCSELVDSTHQTSTMAPSTSTKIGHGLAKVLGIKLDYREDSTTTQNKLSRGESVFSVSSADTYVEDEPTVIQWIQETAPSRQDFLHYFQNRLPFLSWIQRYNLQWFLGDLVAGNSFTCPYHDSELTYYSRYHRGFCRCSPGNGICSPS